MSLLINPRDLRFLLYEFLDTESLTLTERYAQFDKETFDAVIETTKKLAEEKFAPFAAKLDANEPFFDGERVHVIDELREAIDAYVAAGLCGIAADEVHGGMQLPWTISQAACAYVAAADVSANAYGFLTHAAINLLQEFANTEQKKLYLAPLVQGRFFGTMCLSEPQAGSSLSDIEVKALPTDEDYYLLSGTKMWISGGEHDLSENIVHLVLAKIPGGGEGVKGISLFIVPKYRVDSDGNLGASNDVTLAGLNHKMGFRGTTNTVLKFGESNDCRGWLVGEPHQGLRYMFHMMNEARIGIGMTAAVLGYTGYLHSLTYAKERPQGRLPDQKDPTTSQVPIINHTDIKRLLLAQKVAAEGALGLVLFCAHLIDRQKTTHLQRESERIGLLLDILTPVTKSWPSEFCLEANKHAIQILGGYGYTRDFPVERFYRDNRLNPIHEGTHGIQAADLLGRKLVLRDGEAFAVLESEFFKAIEESQVLAEMREFSSAFSAVVEKLKETTNHLRELVVSGDTRSALSNAGIYLDNFGHVVIAWIWLRQATLAYHQLKKDVPTDDRDFYLGKVQACQYFYRYELSEVIGRLTFLDETDSTCADTNEEWF